MDFMVASGLRYEEALNSYNLIVRLNGNGDYYRDEVLEHYRFPEVFFRRTKKVFISIIPENLIKLIRSEEPLTEATIRRRLQRKHIPLRFGDIREFWGNFMLKYLNPTEIDFLQGRIGVSVFMQNYFNPILMGDLKSRVLRALTGLQNSIS